MRSPLAIAHEHLLTPVIQFGPPRTGSTLVWNAIRVLMPNIHIPKRHALSFLQLSPLCRAKIVCTVRDPRDIIVSMLSVAELSPTKQNIEKTIQQLDPQGIDDAIRILGRKDTLFLRYEDFVNDFDVLFDSLGSFLGAPHNLELRVSFEKKFNLAEISKRSASLEKFENFDPDDQIHGRHISSHGGRTGAHKEILDPYAAENILSHYRTFCDAFDYS